MNGFYCVCEWGADCHIGIHTRQESAIMQKAKDHGLRGSYMQFNWKAADS